MFLGGRGRDNVEYKDLKLKQYNRNVARTATSLVGEVKMALLRGRSDLRPQGLQSCRPEPRPEEHPSGAAGMQPLRPKLHTLPSSSRFPLSKGNMGARMALTLVLARQVPGSCHARRRYVTWGCAVPAYALPMRCMGYMHRPSPPRQGN